MPAGAGNKVDVGRIVDQNNQNNGLKEAKMLNGADGSCSWVKFFCPDKWLHSHDT